MVRRCWLIFYDRRTRNPSPWVGRIRERDLPSHLTSVAKQLRKNTTAAEKQLWQQLRAKQLHGFKFKRQQPIGNYIVDFVCFEKRLVIELDGGQHAEQVDRDAARTQWLEAQGFKVIRFWNNAVLQNLDGVWDLITRHLLERND